MRSILLLACSLGLAGCAGDDGGGAAGTDAGTETAATGSTGDASGTGTGGGSMEPVTFEVVLENVSEPWPTSADPVGLPFAPGLWVVHGQVEPLFSEGTPDRGQGLEALAEDGDPGALAMAIDGGEQVSDSDVFDLPEGGYEAGVILPGDRFVFEVEAVPGDRLSFAGMFVQSNDIFLAPGPGGLPLFDGEDQPVSGDLTDRLALWDAGTEVNEEPGVGVNQAPRQPAPNTGEAEGGNVRLVDDDFSYPAPAAFVTLTITPQP